MFLDVKVLGKRNNIIIGFSQQTRNIQYMYLQFKALKKSRNDVSRDLICDKRGAAGAIII